VKILFLSSWYPNRIQPRLGNFIQRHADAVAMKSEVASLFVTSDKHCTQKFEVEEKTIGKVYSVNVYYKKVQHSFPLVSQIQKMLRYCRAHLIGLDKIKSTLGSFDIIHQNVLFPSGAIALLFRLFNGIPYIITEHSTEYHFKHRNSLFSRWLKKKIARNAALICPVSANLEGRMHKQGLHGKYEVVNNVVDTSVFYLSKEKAPVAKIRFLHISTLDDNQKNISGLLRTVQKLSVVEPDCELHIVGDEEYTHHMEYAQSLGILNKKVFFEGAKTLNEVADAMRSSDCFVMFSNYENFPCVIAESLMCGLPIISSDVGGIKEHVNSGNGILVPAQDEPQLLEAMVQMVKNIREKKYNAKAINLYAREQFSYESVSDKFHSIYSRILQK
jgi:L-malate glycosyltransferase